MAQYIYHQHYKTCKECGASLDFNESCDCDKPQEVIEPPKEAGAFLMYVKEMKKTSLTETQIAATLGMTPGQFRTHKALCKSTVDRQGVENGKPSKNSCETCERVRTNTCPIDLCMNVSNKPYYRKRKGE